MANDVRIGVGADDNASGIIDKVRDRFDQLGSSAGRASLVGNLGARAVEAGFNLAGEAIGRATAFIGDSIDAYRSEQVSVAGLNAALAANVQGWNGNTDAIEEVIAAREKLAFSDDEQREALKVLLAVTNDSEAALKAQGVAMDLARFRGISLQQASDVLAKAYDGNVTSLKKLGIQLEAGTKGMEALDAVTKVVGGSAKAYADTDLGKVEAAQIKVDDAMERVGKTFSQVAAVVLPAVADGFEAIVDAVGHLGNALDGGRAKTDAFAAAASSPKLSVGDVMYANALAVENYRASMEVGTSDIGRRSVILSGVVAKVAKDVAGSMKVGFEDSATGAKLAWVGAMDKVRDSIGSARDAIKGAVDSIINDSWDPLINQAEITAARLQLADAQAAASASGLSKTEKAEADLRVLQQKKHLDQLLAQQAEYGSDAALLGYAGGKYTKEQILAGLASKNPDVRKHWEEYVQALDTANAEAAATASTGGAATGAALATGTAQGMANYAKSWMDEADKYTGYVSTIKTGSYDWGWNTGSAWAGGLTDSIYANQLAVSRALNTAIKAQLAGESPPPKGPLHTIDKGAANVAQAWMDGFTGALDPDQLSEALAGIAPELPPGSSDRPQPQGSRRRTVPTVPSQAVAMGLAMADIVVPVTVTLDGREIARAVRRWNRYDDARSTYQPS